MIWLDCFIQKPSTSSHLLSGQIPQLLLRSSLAVKAWHHSGEPSGTCELGSQILGVHVHFSLCFQCGSPQFWTCLVSRSPENFYSFGKKPKNQKTLQSFARLGMGWSTLGRRSGSPSLKTDFIQSSLFEALLTSIALPETAVASSSHSFCQWSVQTRVLVFLTIGSYSPFSGLSDRLSPAHLIYSFHILLFLFFSPGLPVFVHVRLKKISDLVFPLFQESVRSGGWFNWHFKLLGSQWFLFHMGDEGLERGRNMMRSQKTGYPEFSSFRGQGTQI